MTEEDDVYLKILNEKLGVNQCTEDQFEEVMHFFEETAQTKQPYAAVDSPPVLSFAEIQESMDAAVEQSVKHFAKDIYEHWKSRRVETGNLPLQSALKVRKEPPSAFPCLRMDDADSFCSLRRVKKPTTVTHMSASVGVKSARFARLVGEMRRVPKS